MNIVRTMATATLLLLAVPQPAALATFEPFVVAPVTVDVTADSALAARTRALDAGQSLAWRLLLDRMTLEEDAVKVADVGVDDLSRLILGYEILKERTSDVRYLADLSVRFDRQATRKYLVEAGIPFAETRSRPVLVVPVLFGVKSAVLWEEPNPWRTAWQKTAVDQGLVPVVVPYGDLVDIATLSTLQAVRGDRAALTAIADRYGAVSVVVAEATSYVDGTTGMPVVEFAYRRDVGDAPVQSDTERISGTGPEMLPELFARGVQQVVANLTDEWKRANLVATGASTRVVVTVPIPDFPTWLDIRARLTGIAIIKRVDTVGIGRRAVEISLHGVGDLGQITNALRQHGFELQDSGTGYRLLDQNRPIPVPGNDQSALMPASEAPAQ